jgi:hypothetical protein
VVAGSDQTKASLPNQFYPTLFILRTDTMRIVDIQIGASDTMVADARAACPR